MLHRIRAMLGLVLAATLIVAVPVRADDAEKEYLVKAAFLYNFVKFIEWPESYAVTKQTNINICIVGTNSFGPIATNVFRKASTPALTFTVVEEKAWKGNAAGCHMLFVSRSESAKLSEIITAVKSQPVLTVSEIENFANSGGMIGFVMQDNKVKLIVNSGAITAANLRVNAQLLEIALSVIKG